MRISNPLPRLADSLVIRLLLAFVIASVSFLLLVAPVSQSTAVRKAAAPIAVPQAEANFIRQIPISANDIVYSPVTKMLYASIPSSVGADGNSIKTIDPTNGAIASSVFVGSEPNKLALADDGTSLYTALDGAFAIRRFDVLTQTPGLQFPVGQDSFFGLYRVADLAVAPGNPNLVAVARQYAGTSPPEAGVEAFENGVPRTTAGPGHISGSDYLAFSASASKLYGSGFYSGLTTLKIDANGVSITGTSSLASGWRVKFDNGVIYAGNGQVIDPDTNNGTLKGTFSGITNTGSSVAFVSDSSVGRAYYLVADTFGSPTRTLKVFDINTFLQIGSLTINGVVGDATNMIRWGSNGLAFRTTGNQLFIIQTSLIPSSDPIPTPTATPSPTPSPSPSPFATFVRQIALATNDLIYSNTTQSLFASVPSSAGASGNSVIPINPVTATVGNSVFVGSEPNKLALSDDGHTMYVALTGAGAVRRLDINTQTAGLQFWLGNDSFNGPRTANDIAVMPGSPGTVAVSRTNNNTVVYDDGVPRSQASNGGSLAFRSATTLYAANGAIAKLAVAANGLSLASTTYTNSSGNIVYDGGLVYESGGAVADVEAGQVKGTFGTGTSGSLMAVDSANGRVFFLGGPFSGWVLRAFDINTFLPIGSVTIQGINGTPSSLVRWGTNGLAFRTSSNQVFLIQTALVNASQSIPTPTPTPSPVPSPSPAYIPSFMRRLDVQANDLVYNTATQRIYASVPSLQGANGNSLATIDPAAGAVGPFVFVGSEPNKLALADDNQTLYMTLDGASAVRRFDIPTQTPGPQFNYSISGGPADIKVMPGSPHTVALSLGVNNLNNGVAIYDDGVKRANNGQGNYYAVLPIEFNGPSTIYGYDSYSSGFELVKFAVSSSGVAPVTITDNLISGYTSGLKFSNGLLYSSGGRVVDPEAQKLIGTFQGAGGGALALDATLGKIFFLSTGNSSGVILSAYDINTFLPLGSVTLATGTSGTPSGLVRWGSNGLAFRVPQSFGAGSSSNPSAVFLVQSALVSNSSPIPTGIQFNNSSITTFEGVGNVTITVSRSGDVSGTSTVDYATSDGTATAGSDYTAKSGTITFAPGELSKTFTVPIIDDNLYEAGNETFTVTLSNPGGGAVLAGPASLVVTITDNDSRPFISASSTLRVSEGNTGTKSISIPINLSNPSVQTAQISYATADGTATAGSDYVSTSGTITYPPGTTTGNVQVTINGDTQVEPDETFVLTLSNPVNVSNFITQITVTIANDDSSIQLSNASYPTTEGANAVNITVTRTGDTSATSSAVYNTSDDAGTQNCDVKNGKASSRCDYIPAAGTIVFTAGQVSKVISVLISDDAYAEGDETLSFNLTSPVGSSLGSTSTASIVIHDNDSADGPNPIDQAVFLARQHYYDFFSRQPDQSGLDFWVGTITACGGDPQCIEVKRINLSGAFFLSIEFQETGYLVERLYKTAYGDATGNSNFPTPHTLAVPIVRLSEFLPDTQSIGQGVIVGQGNWQQQLETNKQTFTSAFVQRQRFTDIYGSVGNTQFVDMLNANAGNPLSQSERDQLVADLNANVKTRAQVLRTVAEHPNLVAAEFNRAFVLMQFFGYLRRNPDDPQDHDHTGYDFWLTKLNQFGGNFQNAEMVKAFISSDEYRHRFGP